MSALGFRAKEANTSQTNQSYKGNEAKAALDAIAADGSVFSSIGAVEGKAFWCECALESVR